MLITGGSGFLSIHCIAQAISEGYRVRTTIRSGDKKALILNALQDPWPSIDIAIDIGHLEFFTADLLKDDGRNTAVAGCR